MESVTFAERLKEAMSNKGMKQVDLLRLAAAQEIKLGKSQVSQYVSGKAVPRENIGTFLADVLDVDMEWLYGKDKANGNQIDSARQRVTVEGGS